VLELSSWPPGNVRCELWPTRADRSPDMVLQRYLLREIGDPSPLFVKDVTTTRKRSARYLRELGEFLQARRAALKPGDLGLPSSGRRRVEGLRREELASAAGVGVTWYTWLEQGRDIRVSSEMLQSIARTLRLSSSDAAYLFSLAGKHAPEIRESTPKLESTIKAVLDGYTSGPAFAMDELFNVRGFNRVADFIYRFDGYPGSRSRNIIWRDFLDADRKQLYVSWRENATVAVGFLRSVYAKRREDPELEQLIKDLSGASAEFSRIWDASRRRGPSSYAPAEVQLNLPGTGVLKFTSVRLKILTNPDWLVVLMSPADDETATAVSRLMSTAVVKTEVLS
jgi:transcriptional regulator with XRE-family HTH domain